MYLASQASVVKGAEITYTISVKIVTQAPIKGSLSQWHKFIELIFSKRR